MDTNVSVGTGFMPSAKDARITERSEIVAVVLTHGEHDVYEHVVADLVDGGLAPSEICIVHNLVTPGDREIRPAYEGVEVLRLGGNRGAASGMNTGMRHQLARGASWIWVLTHDVRLRPGAVEAMRRAARAAEGYGALGPVLALDGSDQYFSLGGERDRRGGLSHQRSPLALKPGAAGIADTAWLDGAAMLLRAEALEIIGGYDERLYGYLEDAELCLRLERAGWRIGVVADAIASQETGHESRPGAIAYLISRNGLKYRRQVAGTLGVLSAIRESLRASIHYVRILAGPRSALSLRRFYFARLVGTWAGTVAYVLGHDGPPPAWLPGLGDMGTSGRRWRPRFRSLSAGRVT